jgi:hypothetical protein
MTAAFTQTERWHCLQSSHEETPALLMMLESLRSSGEAFL